MQNCMESPNTIRNKTREFKTTMIGGYDKQDVSHYLSTIAEQQSILLSICRNANISISVDDAYMSEEKFAKPEMDNNDYLSQFIGSDASSPVIEEMQLKIDQLISENEQLKIDKGASSAMVSQISEFDRLNSFETSEGDEVAELTNVISEKNSYILELESRVAQLQDNQIKSSTSMEMQAYEDQISALNSIITDLEARVSQHSSNESSEVVNMDLEVKAEYEMKIANLESSIEELRAKSISTSDVFNSPSASLSFDEKAEYEKEIETLKEEISGLNKVVDEIIESSNNKTIEITENCNEVDDLNSEIDRLSRLVADLEAALKDACDTSSVEEETTKLKAEIVDFEVASKIANLRIVELENSIAEMLQEMDNCNEIEDLNSEIERMGRLIADLEAALKDACDTSSAEEEITRLKAEIESLELGISTAKLENTASNQKLRDVTEILDNLTTYKDASGSIVKLDLTEIMARHQEVLAKELELNEVSVALAEKLTSVEDREAIIETNKQLISNDYVQNITKKETEISRLRNQMDKMLIVAEATAEGTIADANRKAEQLIGEAKKDAESIVADALVNKENLLGDAQSVMDNAHEFKVSMEKDIEIRIAEAQNSSEELVLQAKQKAEEVLLEAHSEAQRIQETAATEVNSIMNQAETKVMEIDEEIRRKQQEIVELDNHYKETKNTGLLALKKIYSQLEDILYQESN